MTPMSQEGLPPTARRGTQRALTTRKRLSPTDILFALSRSAGPAVSVFTSAEYDMDRFKIAAAITASRRQAGKAVTILESGKTLGTGTLAEDGFGCAATRIPLPMPPAGKPGGPLSIRLRGKRVDTLIVPNTDRMRAEAFLWQSPNAHSAVFSGERLPEVRFEKPFWTEALIGPYELNTTYYDKDYNVVTKAATPGRYGAVVEIITQSGRVCRRFNTLFRQPENLDWWRHELKADISLPPELGVSPEALAAHPRAVPEFVKWRIVESFPQNSDGAVLLAGLYETKPTDRQGDFYTHPQQLDRQWWVGLKRKLYGWDKQFPKPFVCPQPVKGDPAPVVREGTLEEAGMKPDAATSIDAVLTEWANDTDEAFAVCVVRHGVIVLHKAYGTRDGKPMTVTTKSWMASTTKMLAGALMMMLVDQGLIDLDDAVKKYPPPLRGIKTNKPLTIRHLYTHTSGLQWHWGNEANDMEERIASLVPYLEVGKQYAYNGTGMELGCKVLEAVSGESLPNFYLNHLFRPPGCDNTTAGSASHDAQSVPLDMARMGQMLLNKGAYGPHRFFSEETFEKMLPRRLTKVLGPDTKEVYGIGTSFFGDEGLGEGTFAHGAASAATTRIDPVNDLVISMTRNTAGSNFQKYHQRFIGAIVDGMAD